MHLQDIKILFEYDKWAQGRIFEVVGNLTEEQYQKPLGSSHGGVRGTLVHSYAAYVIWFARWTGTSPATLVKEEEVPTFALLKDRWTKLLSEFGPFVDSLTEERLLAALAYKDTKGNAYSTPLWQQMQHLVNHSTYHRGQVVALLRQLGVRPVGTDLINFYRLPPK